VTILNVSAQRDVRGLHLHLQNSSFVTSTYAGHVTLDHAYPPRTSQAQALDSGEINIKPDNEKHVIVSNGGRCKPSESMDGPGTKSSSLMLVTITSF
jgi:hypothetical protein